MRRVKRSALVPYSAQAMFALVDDIEAYPAFLPWCRAAREHARTETEVEASLELARGGISKWFTTRNHLVRGERIDIELVDGPFRKLEGHWSFVSLGEAGCRVNLEMEFEFSSRMLDMMIGSVFEQICNSLLDAFVERARTQHAGH